MRLQYLPLLALLLVLSACSKDDPSSKCAFIGKWCIPNAPGSMECVEATFIEFLSSGELNHSGPKLTWESSDCKLIEVFDATGSTKEDDYTVLSTSDITMVLDKGSGPVLYIKLE